MARRRLREQLRAHPVQGGCCRGVSLPGAVALKASRRPLRTSLPERVFAKGLFLGKIEQVRRARRPFSLAPVSRP
jgi:hypothetical protein